MKYVCIRDCYCQRFYRKGDEAEFEPGKAPRHFRPAAAAVVDVQAETTDTPEKAKGDDVQKERPSRGRAK